MPHRFDCRVLPPQARLSTAYHFFWKNLAGEPEIEGKGSLILTQWPVGCLLELPGLLAFFSGGQGPK